MDRTPAGAVSTVVRIGSRTSALARWQADRVAAGLASAGVDSRFVGVRTHGDVTPGPLADLGGDGVFVTALEDALLAARIDVAVHSYKDMPTRAPDRLVVAAVLARHDPRDAVVGRPLGDLPAGARVGTSSPRRAAFVRALRPDLEVVPIRGNVPTRLAQVDDGAVAAAVLALAGLERLGLGDRVCEVLAADAFPPAPGQGAIAAQCRRDDPAGAAVAGLDDAASRRATAAERRLMALLGGGCDLALGAWAEADATGPVRLVARWIGPDGEDRRADVTADTPDGAAEAAAAGLGYR